MNDLVFNYFIVVIVVNKNCEYRNKQYEYVRVYPACYNAFLLFICFSSFYYLYFEQVHPMLIISINIRVRIPKIVTAMPKKAIKLTWINSIIIIHVKLQEDI